MWKTKISRILEVYDGYTGQPADAGQFRIVTTKEVLWMPKDNGCIVFCDCDGTEFEVSLRSQWYLGKQILLKNGAEGSRIPIQRAWVFPGPAYPRQKWEILKPGEAPPLRRIVYFPVMTDRASYLLQDIGKQDTYLQIFHKKHECLEGREILLYPSQVRLVLGKETESCRFLLEHSIKIEKEMKKSEVQVIVGHEGITQADGSFQIAAPKIRGSLEKVILYMENQEKEMIHKFGKECKYGDQGLSMQ